MNIEEKLDQLLRILNGDEFNKHSGNTIYSTGKFISYGLREMTYQLINPTKNEIADYMSIFSDQIKELIDILESEGFIKNIMDKESDNKECYLISLKGSMFIKNGGYIQQKRVSNRRRIIQTIHLWSLSAGTILAGLYGLIETIKFVYSYFHQH